MTKIAENARLELLRSQAESDDILYSLLASGDLKHFDGWTPLHEHEAVNTPDDFRLAARECAALGLMELHIDPFDGDYSVRLLPAGYDWIKAHDAIGEASQEGAHA